MHRYQLYNIKDIDELKQKLEFYKLTLESIKMGDVIEDFLKSKSEIYNLKLRLLKFEGEVKIMEENHHKEIAEYEQRENDLSAQINILTNSVSELTQDVNRMMEEIGQIDLMNLFEKIDQVLQEQDNAFTEEKTEIIKLKEEIFHLKEQMEAYNSKQDTIKQPSAPRQSEYRRLQNMLESTKYVEQASNQKKNDRHLNQAFMQSAVNNKKSNPQRSVNNSTTINGKKAFLNPKYELNKNIVTRSTTVINKHKEKKANNKDNKNSTLATDGEHLPGSNNHFANNEKENHVSDPNMQNNLETDMESSNKTEYNSSFAQDVIQTESENTEGNILDTKQSDIVDKSNNTRSESSKKKEKASFFSIFQRRDYD